MTFKQYMMQVRYRLQDIRLKTGGKISDVSAEDGIRWTKEEVEEICKSAIKEVQRTVHAIKLKDYINEAAFNRFGNATINELTGYVEDLPSFFTKIYRFYSQGGNIYSEVDMEQYNDYRHRASQGDPVEPYVFTVIYDETDNRFEARCLPVPNDGGLMVEVSYRTSLDNWFDTGSTEDLPFLELDDLLLDYAEREGKSRDHNENRVTILTKMINQKLSELMAIGERDVIRNN